MRTSGNVVHRNQRHPVSAWATQGQHYDQPRKNQQSANQRLIQAGSDGNLSKRTSAKWLISTYAFVVILSWIITCVLIYQPIGIPIYFDQTGNYSRSHYRIADDWRKAVNVGQSIVAVISITVTSAVCAEAAAMYCQRRSDDKGRTLTLKQMLALADKGWSDTRTLLDLAKPRTSRNPRLEDYMSPPKSGGIGFNIDWSAGDAPLT